MTLLTCENCSQPFIYKMGNKANKYCSIKCYRETQKIYSFTECQACGVSIRVFASRSRKYCSKLCYGKSRERKAVTMTNCLNCKKEFEIWTCRLEVGFYKYCSKVCSVNAQIGIEPWNKNKKSELRGEKHYNWQGGKTPKMLQLRRSFEYTQWRRAVFERDNYTCTDCGDDTGGNLEADHIKPFAYFPEVRFDVNNGRTLCKDCHKKTDTWGSGALKYKKEVVYGN